MTPPLLPQLVEGSRVAEWVEQARREEREACASLCDQLALAAEYVEASVAAKDCAIYIRARGSAA